jgi:hypothetical protein
MEDGMRGGWGGDVMCQKETSREAFVTCEFGIFDDAKHVAKGR